MFKEITVNLKHIDIPKEKMECGKQGGEHSGKEKEEVFDVLRLER